MNGEEEERQKEEAVDRDKRAFFPILSAMLKT